MQVIRDSPSPLNALYIARKLDCEKRAVNRVIDKIPAVEKDPSSPTSGKPLWRLKAQAECRTDPRMARSGDGKKNSDLREGTGRTLKDTMPTLDYCGEERKKVLDGHGGSVGVTPNRSPSSSLRDKVLTFLEASSTPQNSLSVAKGVDLISARDVNATLYGLEKEGFVTLEKLGGKPHWRIASGSESMSLDMHSATPKMQKSGELLLPATQSCPLLRTQAGGATRTHTRSLRSNSEVSTPSSSLVSNKPRSRTYDSNSRRPEDMGMFRGTRENGNFVFSPVGAAGRGISSQPQEGARPISCPQEGAGPISCPQEGAGPISCQPQETAGSIYMRESSTQDPVDGQLLESFSGMDITDGTLDSENATRSGNGANVTSAKEKVMEVLKTTMAGLNAREVAKRCQCGMTRAGALTHLKQLKQEGRATELPPTKPNSSISTWTVSQ